MSQNGISDAKFGLMLVKWTLKASAVSGEEIRVLLLILISFALGPFC